MTKSTMEIFNRDGKRIFCTEHKEFHYPPAIIKQMVAVGYTVKVDGKKVRK